MTRREGVSCFICSVEQFVLSGRCCAKRSARALEPANSVKSWTDIKLDLDTFQCPCLASSVTNMRMAGMIMNVLFGFQFYCVVLTVSYIKQNTFMIFSPE